ncbi:MULTISPECIES: superinfection immunity protein [unclassified Streptomyces]|uniref:superinfection immunity protein n=1 Tax=unclassified Streptomyces TaxID=2593676 RepID=UPI00225BC6C7|nr:MULTISPECIES: superinfection immunity protein [unclassified Streptomyces]MCX5101012.1 superinfection immunity protein [Streptomyces sp. NBC_00439]MCX5550692.1 superinfection immunity protein [Streptomyces sp. NBC_00051]WSC29940.1 superinfection immunity protein [Streptomyces sp. NBC_01768]WSP48798.1 superinfection immunity protein [Streptomyces sp. NBC_01243]
MGIPLYFLPFFIAAGRGVNTGSVFVINLFLGWTFIGWVVALAMSMGTRRTQ